MRYLQPSFCGGLACNFCLRSAFDVMSSDPLSSDVFLPLAAWNFARGSFSSMLSAHAVWECSNFLTLDLHLHSVGDGSRPFQSIRFMYSCIRNWLVRWSPCPLGASARTLCSPFDIAGNLSCGSRSLYASSWTKAYRLSLVDLRRFRNLPSVRLRSACLSL